MAAVTEWADVVELARKIWKRRNIQGGNAPRGEDAVYNVLNALITKLDNVVSSDPVPLRLHCPSCGELHIDEDEFALHPHHTHACQECGAVWRPAIVHTVGVRFLPGFKNSKKKE